MMGMQGYLKHGGFFTAVREEMPKRMPKQFCSRFARIGKGKEFPQILKQVRILRMYLYMVW